MGSAERPTQLGLDHGFIDTRVAVRVQLDGLGNQHRPLPVAGDAAALVDQRRVHQLRTNVIGNHRTDPRVVVPASPILLAPPVEPPVDRTEPLVVVEHERRPDVSHPCVVQTSLDQIDACGQVATRGCSVGGIDDHAHRLEIDDRVRHQRPRCPGLLNRSSISRDRRSGRGKAIQTRSCSAVSAGMLQPISELLSVPPMIGARPTAGSRLR